MQPPASPPEHRCVSDCRTLFSSRPFVEAWTRAMGRSHRALRFSTDARGSGDLYGVGRRVASGLYDVALGPSGLYASPEMEDSCSAGAISRIVAQLRSIRITGFTWNVRFDNDRLAQVLAAQQLPVQRTSTHVLRLAESYEKIFARYNATIRNQVRRTQHNGVSVRAVSSVDDVNTYYAIHTRLAALKGNYSILYPVSLLTEMVLLRDHARLLVAEHEGRMIAGGLFFRDGCSVMYWHGASDRDYSHLFPTSAVVDAAIHWALESGAAFFNFGGSGGLESLEQFKASWNAKPELNWAFQYSHPFWSRVARLKQKIGRAHA